MVAQLSLFCADFPGCYCQSGCKTQTKPNPRTRTDIPCPFCQAYLWEDALEYRCICGTCDYRRKK